MNLRSFAAVALVLAAACDAPAGPQRDRDLADADEALIGATSDVVAASPQTGGDAVVLRFRSIEDPAFPADRSVCAASGFATNVYLGASLWSEASTASSGRIVNNGVRRIGSATACLRITDPTFPPGLPQLFYARFITPEGTFTASGACTLISNDVPEPGLVLGGCHLGVVDGPADMRGGAITSLSTFNPANLAGYATGSEWTMQFYPEFGRRNPNRRHR
ncbi:MAG TPA: hypothetical protein VE871_03685 [Longimicrobium sp.]|nr:hypothetical protein [Longimicrobium sp.]